MTILKSVITNLRHRISNFAWFTNKFHGYVHRVGISLCFVLVLGISGTTELSGKPWTKLSRQLNLLYVVFVIATKLCSLFSASVNMIQYIIFMICLWEHDDVRQSTFGAKSRFWTNERLIFGQKLYLDPYHSSFRWSGHLNMSAAQKNNFQLVCLSVLKIWCNQGIYLHHFNCAL